MLAIAGSILQINLCIFRLTKEHHVALLRG